MCGLASHAPVARIDTWDRDANLIVDIVGLAGVGAFAIGGVAALAGIVTTAAALGALEIAGGLVAAAGLALIVLSVFEGADQREASRPRPLCARPGR